MSAASSISGFLLSALPWIAVAMIGAVSGLAEILGRYQDEPRRALQLDAAKAYIGFNALIAVLAFALVPDLGLPGAPANGAAAAAAPAGTVPGTLGQILLAGLGSMAFFRSSIFRVKVGGEEVGIGPAAVLDVLLQVLDRQVDRKLADERLHQVPDLMADIDFDSAVEPMTALSTKLLQNSSGREQAAFAAEVAILQKSNLDPAAKSIVLGLMVRRILGADLLAKLVKTLKGKNILGEAPEREPLHTEVPEKVATLMAGFDMANAQALTEMTLMAGRRNTVESRKELAERMNEFTKFPANQQSFFLGMILVEIGGFRNLERALAALQLNAASAGSSLGGITPELARAFAANPSHDGDIDGLEREISGGGEGAGI